MGQGVWMLLQTRIPRPVCEKAALTSPKSKHGMGAVTEAELPCQTPVSLAGRAKFGQSLPPGGLRKPKTS